MFEEERKIAKLSRTMNNTSVFRHSNPKTDQEAYKKTIRTLQNSLESEKLQNDRDQHNYNLNVQVKLAEDSIKQSAYRHHLDVLQAQIQEKNLNQKILTEDQSSLDPHPYSETVPKKNLKLRQEILNQIKQNEEKKKSEIQNEINYGKRLIEDSNKLLENEIKLKNDIKNNVVQSMVQSWEENIRIKKLKKELESIRIYGTKPEVQPVVDNVVYERPESEEQLVVVHKKRFKSLERTRNWKNNLRNFQFTSPVSSKAHKSYNGVIEKFSKLAIREKKIKIDKQKILDYFKSKKKPLTLYSTPVPDLKAKINEFIKLPRLN
jgi:hypothetical protein